MGPMIGCIICKGSEITDDSVASLNNPERNNNGYVAMLTVSESHRKRGIGQTLATLGINRMKKRYKCEEIVLETEVSNVG